MRLLMVVSADGFLCSGPADDMMWTGSMDKRLFRVLTGVGRVCAAGSTTRDIVRNLPGRTLFGLSRHGYTLEDFAGDHPDGWLLGGLTVAVAALRAKLLDEVHLSWICDVKLGSGVAADLVFKDHLTDKYMSTTFGNVVLECYETTRG